MNKDKILGVSKNCFYGVVAVCLAGIIIGSFADFRINVLLENKTAFGTFFATYGSYFSYCLYPAAGMCIFKGLMKKGGKYRLLAWVILAIAFFMAVYYSNNYNGKSVRALFGYSAGKSCPALSVLCWLFWAVLYSWVPFVLYKVLDDTDADKLIAIGAVILIAGIVSDYVNLWLKQVASRPRYKYLITLDKPISEYRQWWQMVPNLAGSNDNFKSWPSGNMTIAAMMFSLPMLTDAFKSGSSRKNTIAFILACIFVAGYGYNRIHMTNHFLTDVCFGTLITYLIHCAVYKAFSKTLD